MILSKEFFSKHQKKEDISPQIINLDDTEVLSSDFPGLSPASLTSGAFASSLASTASKAQFPQKLPDPDGLIINGTKITTTGNFLWNG